MLTDSCRQLAAVLFGVALMFAPASAATEIGVAAAVKNEVEGIQGGAPRRLAPGSQLFELETVKTGVESAAQLIFLDETSLSIGPQAQITLDRFVFDPKRNAGDMVMSASRGAFRFITGSQDPRNYRIRTPVATIGVRGTILDCFQGPSWLLCILQEGAAIFEVGATTHRLNRPGRAILINADGRVRFFTPDGTFFEDAGIFAFPLYGLELDGAIRYLDVQRDMQEAIDELNSHDARADGGGGGGGSRDDDGGGSSDDDTPPSDDDTPGDDDTPPRDDDSTGDDGCGEFCN
jgi:hypothetical protein